MSVKEIVCRDGIHELYGYYFDNGSDNNLVLIPGTYTHHSIWIPVVQNANLDANLLLAELPGFGKSRPRSPVNDMENLTAQTLKIVDAAGIDRFFVGGHSLGGMMSIEMIDHAGDRLDGVIPVEGWPHYTVEKDAFGGLKYATLTEEHLRLANHYDRLGSYDWPEDERKEFAKVWRKWDKGASILAKATVPIFTIWGDRGREYKPSRHILQLPDKENIEVCWIPDAAHSMLVQYPDLLGRHIAQFIDRTTRK